MTATNMCSNFGGFRVNKEKRFPRDRSRDYKSLCAVIVRLT